MPQIRAAFKLAPTLMTRELNLAIRKSVLTIGRRSRQNTPVLTGRLRASTAERFSNLQGEVGTHTNYDVFVHEGTKFMKGRPYLQQAVESEGVEVQKFFTDAVENVLNDIGKKT
jgi:hypothetical protein